MWQYESWWVWQSVQYVTVMQWTVTWADSCRWQRAVSSSGSYLDMVCAVDSVASSSSNLSCFHSVPSSKCNNYIRQWLLNEMKPFIPSRYAPQKQDLHYVAKSQVPEHPGKQFTKGITINIKTEITTTLTISPTIVGYNTFTMYHDTDTFSKYHDTWCFLLIFLIFLSFHKIHTEV